MVYMGNFSGLFMMWGGGLASCICWGGVVLREFASVLGVIVWLFVIYLVLSVRGGGCLMHGDGQS